MSAFFGFRAVLPIFRVSGRKWRASRQIATSSHITSISFLIHLVMSSDTERGVLGRRLPFFLVFIMIMPIFTCGCSHFHGGLRAGALFKEANDLFNQGSYREALGTYEQIVSTHSASNDRALFEMGIIHAHPRNEQKDYQKSLECFQRIVRDFPQSEYRRDSEMMIFQIHNVSLKDQTIAAQQTQIETFRQMIKTREQEITALREKIEACDKEREKQENEITSLHTEIFFLRGGRADKIIIEKMARRLTLLSKGRALKTYTIALGGNPDGPKERQGDNKTPEGTYVIDSRNRDSRYHLSLHISYPNEHDKKRARELGVSPGGDIMIHGLKNGFSWAGDFHTEVDWTKGCIAVTNEEIEEIDKLVPNGTIVEIVP